MKEIVIGAAALLGVAAFSQAAEAGCVKGAVVGGIAGKMMGHGYAGAAAGCAIGHSRAKRNAAESTGSVNRRSAPGQMPANYDQGRRY
jgi:hypothetical protein